MYLKQPASAAHKNKIAHLSPTLSAHKYIYCNMKEPEKTEVAKEPAKRVFAFDRMNFILLAAGMAVVIAGMILMSGSGSDETTFNDAIFSARRIKVAPAVCLFGYLFMIYGIMRKPKH